tara:strand:- start:588 stop:1553 length:966 start_codon:yes stop_codon:yes gene_type:complete
MINKSIKYTLSIILVFLTNLNSEEPLTVGFWNVENLFDLENDPIKNDDEFSYGGRKNVDQEIYDLKINNCSEVLFDLNADILGLCEVENLRVLNDLNIAYKERDYSIIHYDSPDNRGIDNALFYDKNIFSIISSRAIANRLNNGIKTRDILYVEGEYQNKILHLFINHWPSNYGGKEKAIPKRTSTAELIFKEIELLTKTDEFAEIILLGDFNENPDDKNIKLLEKIGLISLMKPMLGKQNIGTYVYRGKDYLYDQIIVNDQLQNIKNLSIENKSIYILDLPKYRQQEGNYKHYPFRFWAGNKLLGGYSDHLAIKVKIISN